MQIGNILVTGGLGFVGSNTVIELFTKTTAKLYIIDDLSNSFHDVLQRITIILTEKFNPEEIERRITYKKLNLLNLEALEKVFQNKLQAKEPFDTILHFAAKKSVGESLSDPLAYYDNNFVGSLNLFKMMQKFQCHNFIFSSTAALYGEKDNCVETDQINPMNPYAESKACVEMLMKSLSKKHPKWKMISLRYFNPVGAHPTGLLGDDPSEYPTNLIPCIQEFILGKRPQLKIFGDDYETFDGTGVRDFIHINDLANAHVKALQKLKDVEGGEVKIYNLGTGKGSSVLEVVKGFEKALGRPLNYSIVGRRESDLPQVVANVEKANKQLGWRAQKTILDVCVDCINFLKRRYSFQQRNQ